MRSEEERVEGGTYSVAACCRECSRSLVLPCPVAEEDILEIT